ncbi:MAG: c-type cytochrome [Azospirillum sp.]|nr:c-type cytochrome [Azospirillum sp.]MCZ8124370.1 c-type cytochrome [Magnetospirillum sp.]
MKSLLAAAVIALGLPVLTPAPAQAADAAAGEAAARRLCAACHIFTAEGRRGVGPTLFGLVGRKSGAVEGFRYSTANQNANVVWTPEVLDKYLMNPREFMPGTTMAFAGIRNETERANVIAYLQTLK